MTRLREFYALHDRDLLRAYNKFVDYVARQLLRMGAGLKRTELAPGSVGEATLNVRQVLLAGDTWTNGGSTGPGGSRTETTQTDFSTGSLSGVVATSAGDLELESNPALSFDGVDDYVDLGRPPSLNLTASWTLEAWVLPTSLPRGAGVITEAYSGDGIVQYELGFGMNEPAGGTARLKVGFFHSGSWSFASDSVDITTGQWVHIAGTWDGITLRVYKNGVLVGSNEPGRSPIAGSESFWIGRRHDTAGSVNFFPGYIDDVRIWNVARTQAEIQAGMNRELTGSEAGLVGYWKFNEGSGTTANDSTANGNHGTLNGGVAWTSHKYWSGYRTSPTLDLSPVGIAASSTIAWTATTPAGTTVTVETNLSLDGGVTWQGWQQATNGGPIPGISPGTNVSNARLQWRQTLTTQDTTITPALHELSVVVGVPPGGIEWNAHTLYWNGQAYGIAPGATSRRYVYWPNGATAYSTSDTYPSLGPTDFLIATNINGVYDAAWNRLAKEAVGDELVLRRADLKIPVGLRKAVLSGIDGDLVVSADTTIPHPLMYYRNLTVEAGKTLYAMGVSGAIGMQYILVAETLTLHGTISGRGRGPINPGAPSATGGRGGVHLVVFARRIVGTGVIDVSGADAGGPQPHTGGTGYLANWALGGGSSQIGGGSTPRGWRVLLSALDAIGDISDGAGQGAYGDPNLQTGGGGGGGAALVVGCLDDIPAITLRSRGGQGGNGGRDANWPGGGGGAGAHGSGGNGGGVSGAGGSGGGGGGGGVVIQLARSTAATVDVAGGAGGSGYGGAPAGSAGGNGTSQFIEVR